MLSEIVRCVNDFREMFFTKNMPRLYLFIERYMHSSVKELAAFASGLRKDIAAVENAVASPLSNGFVEGTNSKLKTLKKAMYGRCGIELLTLDTTETQHYTVTSSLEWANMQYFRHF